MDLSRFKWPVIIIVLLLGCWLFSSAGVDYQFRKFTADEPGVDPDRDKVNEVGLTKLGGFLMYTFRYAQAEQVLMECCQRFPEGDNYWYNYYRLARLAEKLKEYGRAVEILEDLMAESAHKLDSRIPENAALKLRADTLIEVHGLRRR